jgi:MFS family permease
VVAGGGWATDTPPETRRNLRFFFWDGMLSAGLEGITPTYIPMFMLALGASSSLIGQMSSLGQLLATLVLLPGALVAERTGRRKLLFALCGGGIARFFVFVIALLPFFLSPQSVIYAVIALRVMGDGLGNFSGPGWTSLAGDLVPPAWRGRFFGSRNLAISLFSMASTYLAGRLITHFTGLGGYQLAFGFAFATGMISTLLFLQIKEPPFKREKAQEGAYNLKAVLVDGLADRDFRTYLTFGIIWNLAIGIGAPYFLLYYVQGLHATPVDVSILMIAGMLAGMPGLRLFGHLADSLGNRRVLLICGLIIPILPFFWILARIPLHGMLINSAGGLLWAGFNLATFNFLLALAPPEKRARYAALFQIAVTASTALGTFLGSLIVGRWGYYPIFALTGSVRYLGIFFFARYVRAKAGDSV